MKAIKCESGDLYAALRVVNEKYDDNIRFNRFDHKGNGIHFTLHTVSSKEAGGARSGSGRRTGSACWHVHGDLFDALFEINPEAKVYSAYAPGEKWITKDGGNWQDWQKGSMMNPVYASECCDC